MIINLEIKVILTRNLKNRTPINVIILNQKSVSRLSKNFGLKKDVFNLKDVSQNCD